VTPATIEALHTDGLFGVKLAVNNQHDFPARKLPYLQATKPTGTRQTGYRNDGS